MAARLVIEGGVPLQGRVSVSAAKNAALPALAASLLTAEPVTLPNLPELGDVRTMLKLLQTHGAEIEREGRRATVRVPRVTNDVAPYELVSTMRASVLVLGPLVARHGSARVALPGGCAIGVRPIDQHLKGLAKLGAEIAIENGYVVARASRLRGARITTDLVTVTGTENLMMAAALADGTTVIENAAREPEVADLAALLTAMGAKLDGVGTGHIEIQGVPSLGDGGRESLCMGCCRRAPEPVPTWEARVYDAFALANGTQQYAASGHVPSTPLARQLPARQRVCAKACRG